ncbi:MULTISPECIES: Na+/H+ antiporter subunit E [Pseudoalteromonas]|uniref:Cation:proton antiporter n=1 Tax=Pseudoalteromonas ruthenica TaxID=151081 RepID=A0A0F4Q1G2_9GAMM|nr:MULTISPECIES: Na+/H+ antiporter subunit E [Pseudoalteromonas]KJZ00793.1 cation:proton antiporter [Pseudoalteromonas ruthenica]KJZ01154.1 cation:proton antiporter [Pseudoalteromonas ruthenica]MCF2863069.1 Na+/H+ antiporter subunit E [Pseudoalteromonas sp. CNAT2-18]MCG7543056.1 Na+/H+ antiporter subunit E [Pseudoalteromonas sp. MM17-2]MCG7559221.1 Na+/H+ antiporter subunit E [Pseudoalteromonas sp. CNAT2-18.1]|tara:strand:- start:27173 stop:27709 length:537 start_codon:yes stop_codon:yes gene_type:complete
MRLQAKYKWLPTPFRTILLFAVWLLLNNSVSPGHLILGAVLAIVIPLSIAPFRKPQPLILRPGLAFKQLLIVLWDIITANVEVAIKILGPSKRLRPGFIKVPLDLKHDLPITMLASTVSLTPGTVSAEVYPIPESLPQGQEPEQRFLLIHVLDMGDEQELINSIKSRYEAPLKEIFQC